MSLLISVGTCNAADGDSCSEVARILAWQRARAQQQAEYDGCDVVPKFNANMAAWQRFWTAPACMEPCCYISNCGTTNCNAPPPKSASCRGNTFMKPPDAEFFLCMHGRTTAELSKDACRGQWCGPCFRNPEGSFHPHDEFLRVDAHGSHTIVRRDATPLVTATREWVAADAPLMTLDMLTPDEMAGCCICGMEFTEENPPAGMPFCPRKHARHYLNSDVLAPLHADCLVLTTKHALGDTVAMTLQDSTVIVLCPTCIHEEKIASISRDFDAGVRQVAAAWTTAKTVDQNAWAAAAAAAYDSLHVRVLPSAETEATWAHFVAAAHGALRALHPQPLYRQLAERATAAAAEWNLTA